MVHSAFTWHQLGVGFETIHYYTSWDDYRCLHFFGVTLPTGTGSILFQFVWLYMSM